MVKPNELELVGALSLAIDAYHLDATAGLRSGQALIESAETIRAAWLASQQPSAPASPSSVPSAVEAMLREAAEAGWELDTNQEN
jgi:hypothetical protein